LIFLSGINSYAATEKSYQEWLEKNNHMLQSAIFSPKSSNAVITKALNEWETGLKKTGKNPLDALDEFSHQMYQKAAVDPKLPNSDSYIEFRQDFLKTVKNQPDLAANELQRVPSFKPKEDQTKVNTFFRKIFLWFRSVIARWQGKTDKRKMKQAFATGEASLEKMNKNIPAHESYKDRASRAKLRLATFNVALLENPATKGPNLEKILKSIDDTNPDVFVLQELKSGHPDMDKLNLELAKRGYAHNQFGFNLRLNGNIGNGLYSKIPLESKFTQSLELNIMGYKNVVGGVAIIRNEHVLILGTHLSHGKDPSLRIKELEAINSVLENAKSKGIKSHIVMGDFNSEWNLIQKYIPNQKQVEPTLGAYSNWQHRLIDHVTMDDRTHFATNPKFFHYHTDASDHLPVIADLTIPPQIKDFLNIS
jgi:endonuclease/exonuclease/phosphatase family metal-dependent hydrolase